MDLENHQSLLAGQYLLEEFLTTGKFGTVFRAWDTKQSQSLVILILQSELAEDKILFSRIKRRVDSLVHLNHPNIIPVYGILESDGAAFLLSKFFDGITIKQYLRLQKKKIQLPEVMAIARDLCAALEYSHSSGITHGNIKSENILISRDGNILLGNYSLIMPNRTLDTPISKELPDNQSELNRDILDLALLLESVTDSLESLPNQVKEILTRIISQPAGLSITSIFNELCTATNLSLEDIPLRIPEPVITAGHISKPRHSSSLSVSAKPIENDGFLASPGQLPLPPVIDIPVTHPGKTQIPFAAYLLVTASILAPLIIALLLVYNWTIPLSDSNRGTKTAVAELHATQNALSYALSLTPAPTETDLPTFTPQPSMTSTITPTPIGASAHNLIAFASNRTGVSQIYLINPDGKEEKQITDLAKGACQPAWSPDGKKIAFISPCLEAKHLDFYSKTNIYTMNSDGSNIEELPLKVIGGNFDPAWSPDGSHLAYVAVGTIKSDELPHLHIFDFRSKEITAYLPTIPIREPQWGPDGTRIIFEQIRSHQIWIIEANGTGEPMVFSSPYYYAYCPAWSPDGETIIFGQQRFPMLVTKQLSQAVHNEKVMDVPVVKRPAWDVSFSSDGNYIVFSAKDSEIYRYLLSGDQWDLIKIASGYHPAWSP